MQPKEEDIFKFNEEGEQDFQILAENHSTTPQDIFFDQVVAALQEIILDQKFQQNQNSFMKSHASVFQQGEQNKIEYMGIFKQYQNQIEKFIEKNLIEMVPGFEMALFLKLLEERNEQIDQQILDMLHSFTDFEIFKRLILDYKAFYEEEERLKSLTIKSNKIPQQKKVKGNSNIFASSEPFSLSGEGLNSLKKTQPKNKNKEKTEQQILMPEMIITVRPLKKKS